MFCPPVPLTLLCRNIPFPLGYTPCFLLAPNQWVKLIIRHLLGCPDHCARKRDRVTGGWETPSLSHLDHPSTRTWLPSTYPDESQDSDSERRQALPSSFNRLAGCVYCPINYLSASFNSISPGRKLQTMIPMWLSRVMEITKMSSPGEHQAV